MTAYLSPSKVEVYRKYVEGEPNYVTAEHVIAAIRGTKEWKPAYDLGAGFHLALEKGPERYWCSESEAYVVSGRELAHPQVFTPDHMQLVLRYRARYAAMTHEVSLSYERITPGGRLIVMRMRVDGLYGLEVHEHKTTSRPVYIEQYLRSLQWRSYLAATGGHLCQYNVFEFKQEPGEPLHIEPHAFTMYPYPGMEAELLGWVDDYLDFVELNHLQEFVWK
jgi:hypothetical protein